MRTDLQTVAALFSPARLRQARQLGGLTRTELARRASVSGAAVGQYESGASRPRPATVGALALALSVPAEFLAGGREPELPTVTDAFFRSLRSTSKREREQAAATAALLVQLVRAIESSLDLPPLSGALDGLPELAPDDDPERAEQAAACLRERWGLGEDPIDDLIVLLEQHGIVVARLPFAGDRVDAFSWIGEPRPIIILGTSKDGYERSRFDAAHELGHIAVHHADPEPADPQRERQANRFASAFLMPESVVRDAWPLGRLDWNALIRLKHDLGVSLAALLYRGKDLGLLAPDSHENAMRYLTRRWGRTTEPGTYRRPEQPGLVNAALGLLNQHGHTLDELCRQAQLLTAEDLIDRLGINAEKAPRLTLVPGPSHDIDGARR